MADDRARGRRCACVGRASRRADDARASRSASGRPTRIWRNAWSAQRVVQMDRRSGQIRDEQGVRDKFGVAPAFIPDYLALVGDAADGYPGIAGIGAKTAARLITQHGAHRRVSRRRFSVEHRERALLFKTLATLRTDAPLFANVDELRWNGPSEALASMMEKMGDSRLPQRLGEIRHGSH